MLTVAQLEEDRRELVAQRDSLIAKIDALDRLIRLYTPIVAIQPIESYAEATETVPSGPYRSLEDVFKLQPRPSMRFDWELLEVLRQFPFEKNWTSRIAYAELIQRGIEIVGKDADAQINSVLTALHRLQTDGQLRVIQAGAGRRPTIFRLTLQEGQREGSDLLT